MIASRLAPFLDTCSLSISSLGRKALYIVIKFLILWTICLKSSLVHFKNSPEYITSRTAHVFIPLMRFLLQSLVSRSFQIRLKFSVLIFSFIVCLMAPASNNTWIFVIFLFTGRSDFLLVVLFLQLFVFFQFFFMSMVRISMPNSIPICISLQLVLTFCEQVDIKKNW